jgi:enterochelin esterase-like enzyme
MKVGGRVEVSEISTSFLPNPMVYRVYLPPCYDEDTNRSYPVLYLVHGQSFNDDQWERLGVPETADRLIAAGEMAPFIAVMPADRVWKEPTEDKFGIAVAKALVPWIDANYRTIPDRAHRAVGGLSRGGAWAVHLGLAYWELFGTIGVHSGFVFHSDVQPIHEWLEAIPAGETPRIYMDIGNADRPDITEGATWLEGLLTKKGIPHEWHMFVGQHNEEYWTAHVEDYLRFYTQEWGE